MTRNECDAEKEIVVVTGGSSGIGANTVGLLEQRNIKTIILDNNARLRKLGRRTAFYQIDLCDAEAIASIADCIRSDHGHPTVLVNNAGIANDDSIASVTPRGFVGSLIKAGMLAFHEGILQDLKHVYRAPAVRATIVHFTRVKTPMGEKLVVIGELEAYVTAHDVASAVVNQVTSGYGGQLIVPPTMAWNSMIRAFLTWLQEDLRDKVTLDLLKAMQKMSQRVYIYNVRSLDYEIGTAEECNVR
ncbi:all-trans-retinol dehydrogenase (NAD+) [Microdochium nivale]|nr:all-trans-retinol dehydrogenase (NAD+) [Microdochium nivale]